MAVKIRIATWNLCLGLASKKNLVKHYITENKIDICCLQETELDNQINEDLLSFPGYSLEVEQNDLKRRVGMYVRSTVNYRRRTDLEANNRHLIVIDVLGKPEVRIITIYRTFKPQEDIAAREVFNDQLNMIKANATMNCVVLGDFNIDYKRKFDVTYASKHLFTDFESTLAHLGFYQHVSFPTWSRTVNGSIKESILDHVYSNTPTHVQDLMSIAPIFGDHLLILFDFSLSHDDRSITWKRDWRFYSGALLCNELSKINWNINVPNVQQC